MLLAHTPSLLPHEGEGNPRLAPRHMSHLSEHLYGSSDMAAPNNFAALTLSYRALLKSA